MSNPKTFPYLGTRAARAAIAGLVFLLIPTLACAGTEAGAPPVGAAAAQGDLVAMLPAEAVTVGYVDYAALRDSSIWNMVEEDASIDDIEELEEFIARTGMNPRTDVHRLAFTTGRVGGDSDNSFAVVVAATFDRARMETALGEYESSSYQGHTVWHVRDLDTAADDTDTEPGDAADPDRGGYVTIVTDDTLALGSLEMVERIIAVREGAASARSNERLSGLMEDVDADSELWVVTAQDRLVADLAPRGNGTPAPQIPVDRIRSMILSARFSDGLTLELRGRTEAAEDAKLLGDSLNGMLAFGKMMVQSNAPEVFSILDTGIRAGSSGRDVTLRAQLSAQDIQTLRKYAEDTLGGEAGSEIGG